MLFIDSYLTNVWRWCAIAVAVFALSACQVLEQDCGEGVASLGKGQTCIVDDHELWRAREFCAAQRLELDPSQLGNRAKLPARSLCKRPGVRDPILSCYRNFENAPAAAADPQTVVLGNALFPNPNKSVWPNVFDERYLLAEERTLARQLLSGYASCVEQAFAKDGVELLSIHRKHLEARRRLHRGFLAGELSFGELSRGLQVLDSQLAAGAFFFPDPDPDPDPVPASSITAKE